MTPSTPPEPDDPGETLAALQPHVQEAVLGIPDLYFLTDAAGTLLDYRARVETSLYVPPLVFLGKRVADILPADIANRFQMHLESALTSDDPIFFEYALPFADGERHFEAHLRRLGEGRGCVTIVRDITERVETTRELEAYRQHLEEMVASRTAELEAAKTAAESANRAKSAFLSNMSHEIRTPMNSILGFTHLIGQDPLNPRQTAQLDRLTGSAQHLLRIIDDILDLAKIEADKLPLAIADFEPARVIDHVADRVSGSLAAKGLDLVIGLDRVPSVLRGDGVKLGQILLNLVGNAIKFTQRGEITMLGSVAELDADPLTLRLEVRDTGIGMSEHQLSSLFRPFEQADATSTRRYGGTGLGLTISKRLTELMGGRIGVESRPGGGSRFWVEIPFAPSSQDPNPLGIDGQTESVEIPTRLQESPCARSGQVAETPEWERVSAIMARLERLLMANDTAANDLFTESASLLIAALGDDGRRIGQQIQDYDYSRALESLLEVWK
ncbi:sensor histidine kinase [Imhoffiella purpurea]|uniref:Sensory/regulatory protein RpfC n=1 Tax=Imhoffiella purpurea TaxID=1249627 RepID=W9V980_9GAMM|nr:ATP-binding protein [Imhoffiella purpurea]EXJ16168.1 hypothetical protein D779_0473 [Imhoffiella purpurea]